MKTVQVDWTELKTLFLAKGLTSQLQYLTDDNNYYDIWFYDGHSTTRYEASIDSVAVSADRTDFETNYKSSANAVTETKTSSLIRNTDGDIADVINDGINERLAVDAITVDNPYPGISFRAFLESGGSGDMNVDGSSTPVTFSNGPSAGKIWYVSNITIIIEDVSMNFAKFGGQTALTNGVDFKAKENGGSLVTLANIKRNGGFYAFANSLILDSSTTDFLTAQINLFFNSRTTLKLNGDDSDVLEAVVNDDLTSLDLFHVIIRGYEVDA